MARSSRELEHHHFTDNQLHYQRDTKTVMEYDIIHPLKIFDLAKSQGRFVYASAPMVRYSKLAFRQTVYSYGTDICWTPMVLAKEFNRSHFARDSGELLATSLQIRGKLLCSGES